MLTERQDQLVRCTRAQRMTLCTIRSRLVALQENGIETCTDNILLIIAELLAVMASSDIVDKLEPFARFVDENDKNNSPLKPDTVVADLSGTLLTGQDVLNAAQVYRALRRMP